MRRTAILAALLALEPAGCKRSQQPGAGPPRDGTATPATPDASGGPHMIARPWLIALDADPIVAVDDLADGLLLVTRAYTPGAPGTAGQAILRFWRADPSGVSKVAERVAPDPSFDVALAAYEGGVVAVWFEAQQGKRVLVAQVFRSDGSAVDPVVAASPGAHLTGAPVLAAADDALSVCAEVLDDAVHCKSVRAPADLATAPWQPLAELADHGPLAMTAAGGEVWLLARSTQPEGGGPATHRLGRLAAGRFTGAVDLGAVDAARLFATGAGAIVDTATVDRTRGGIAKTMLFTGPQPPREVASWSEVVAAVPTRSGAWCIDGTGTRPWTPAGFGPVQPHAPEALALLDGPVGRVFATASHVVLVRPGSARETRAVAWSRSR